MAYKTIPVNEDTYAKILELCEAYEMGKRAQGAMVGKLVNQEHTKLKALKLLPKGAANTLRSARRMGKKPEAARDLPEGE